MRCTGKRRAEAIAYLPLMSDDPGSAGLAIGLACGREEAATQHALQIRIVDPAGKLVFVSGSQPIYQPRFVETSPALPLTSQLPAFCGFPPSAFGTYAVRLLIDGIEKKTLAFVVVTPPAGTQ